MKTKFKLIKWAALPVWLSTLIYPPSVVFAQGTAFTYQGQLQNNGALASGTYNLTFTLFTNNAGGTSVAGPVTNNGVGVTNGLFTVTIDFGASVWNGATNWLEIGVETNGATPFSSLMPRQELTPTPYAIYAESVTASGISGLLTNAQLAHSAVTVDAGPGFSGGGKVGLGSTITLTNTGVLSVTGNADITATTVSGAVTLGDTATSANTPNTIVKRDGTGSFSAGSVTLAGTLTFPDVALTPVVVNSGSTLLMSVDTNLDLFLGLDAGPGFSGSGNTGVGFEALNGAVGSDNTAVGIQTLVLNNGGSYNTAIGAEALVNNSTGNGNTALGYVALLNNGNGSGNTATGSGAMYSNTNGSENTGLGNNALFSNTLGSNNTASGYEALFSNTSGSDNTANGAYALNVNTTGNNNTANGYGALENNTYGTGNTANGYNALVNNLSGYDNVANGRAALFHNTYGADNTADGVQALNANTNGIQNTAVGFQAMFSNTGGGLFGGLNNTAIGYQALYSNTTGSGNIALGDFAGYNITTGTENIDIYDQGTASDTSVIRIGTPGDQVKTFIAGISGATAASGVAVYVNTSGQLGTLTSSRRFKDDILSMDQASDVLYALKPVTFKYKPDIDPQGLPQFGLVAEDVEKVAPDLVAHDDQGKVYTVRYQAVDAMLLNEFLKQHRTVQEQSAEIQNLKQQNDSLEKRLNELEKAVAHVAEKSGTTFALDSRATEDK